MFIIIIRKTRTGHAYLTPGGREIHRTYGSTSDTALSKGADVLRAAGAVQASVSKLAA